MNEDFTELENELKRLRPRSLPAPLVGRIAGEFAAEASTEPRRFVQWPSWILPAVAAALLAVAVTSVPFIIRDRASQEPAAKAAVSPAPARVAKAAIAGATDSMMLPVRATNVLYDAVNEGVVRLDDNTLARRMRLNYLDTITWENPKSGASLQRTVPREEILFIPVTAN